MIVQIDPQSAVPIFAQLVREVQAAIARGACVPGDMIPSVRNMATQALVNPNTVAKAYRDLERDGILYTRRGQGFFVADDAPERCRQDLRNDLQADLQALLDRGARLGLNEDDLHSMLFQALDTLQLPKENQS